jgi:hypothetical protein
VIAELKWAKENFHIKKICFIDDLFIHSLNRAETFLKKYKEEIGLPFACEVHPLHVNEETIPLLSDAGCATVGMGVQTISEGLRKGVLNRPGDNSKIISAIKEFKKTNIFVFVEIIIGLPNQNEGELVDIIKFFQKHKPDFVLPLWLRYYPKIDIMSIAQQLGVLSPAAVTEIEHAKEFKPVSIKGNSFTREVGRLGNLMLISQLLPSFVTGLILRKKFYRFFPAETFTLLRLTSVWMSFLKRVASHKKRFMYLSAESDLKNCLHYVNQRFFNKSRSKQIHHKILK